MSDEVIRKRHLQVLREMAEEYHYAFCVVRSGVPTKPQSEQTSCLDEIYRAAKVWGFMPQTVDDLMDEAERMHAQYTLAS